jgi:acyl-CoA reductase-like NAD-dependent aldehyde dehydrogenase
MFNQLFIDNEFVPARSGEGFDAIDPATEARITTLPLADAGDVDRAVRSAHGAFRAWKNTTPAERTKLLLKAAALIEARKDEIARLETLDMGKPLRESYANVARSVRTFEYAAGATDKIEGQSIPVDARTLNFTRLEPVGVTAHITPWNYPFANACRSVPVALATGCTVVLKPASDTCLTTLLLGDILRAAGFPPGVVNIVTGSGSVAGAALARHPLVRAITFTGSIGTGQRIAQYAAEHIRPVVLELGGKNPQIVCADADFELALKETLRGGFMNAGQVCTGVSRVLVERSLYPRYVEALKARVDALTVAPGMDNADMGPLVSQAHRQTVMDYATVAQAEGGRIVSGGRIPEGLDRGWYYRPTVFDQVKPSMRIAREEVFGPLLAVMPFDSDDEALAIANESDFGLTAGIFTRDLNRAMRFVRDIEAGMAWVNEWFQSPVQVPHGGVKTSGIGREQGMAAFANYLHTKDVAIRLA